MINLYEERVEIRNSLKYMEGIIKIKTIKG